MATASHEPLLEDSTTPATPRPPTPTARPAAPSPVTPATPASPAIMPASWRVRVPTVPERGSLFDLLYQNQGTALFVRPILWTEQHTALLRATFVARAPILAPVPDSRTFDKKLRQSRVAEDLRRHVAILLSDDPMDGVVDAWGQPDGLRSLGKPEHIRRVLATLYPTTFSCCVRGGQREFRLYFGLRGYRCYMRAAAVWTLGGAAGPGIAYVNREELATLRRMMFSGDLRQRARGGWRINLPVRRLLSLKLKEVLPRDADRDAYLVGLFVAMAQAHFYDGGPEAAAAAAAAAGDLRGPLCCQPTAVAALRDVTLRIVTHDNTTLDFLVYTAVVTASFLQRFLTPTKAASAGATDGLRITLVRVPAFPIVGLKERLGQALGHDLVGSDLAATMTASAADGEEDGDVYRGMETWETAKDRQMRLAEAAGAAGAGAGTKRKQDEAAVSAAAAVPAMAAAPATTGRDDTTRKKRRTRSSVQVC